VVGYFAVKRGALLVASGTSPVLIFATDGTLLLLTALAFLLLLTRTAVEALP
jgi:hypothetical protein